MLLQAVVLSMRLFAGPLDTAAYQAFTRAFAANDVEGLHALTVRLEQGARVDTGFVVLVRAATAFRTDDLAEAARLLDGCMHAACTDPRLKAVAGKLMAMVADRTGDPGGAMAVVEETLGQLNGLAYPQERIDLLVVGAEVHIRAERFDEALKWLGIAQHEAEAVGYARGACLVRINLGRIRYAQDRYDEAWRDFMDAYECARAAGAGMIAQNALGNLSSVAVMTERYEDALNLFDSLLVDLGGRSPALAARTLVQRSYMLAELGDHRSASIGYERAIALQDSLGDVLSAQKTRGHLSNTLWAEGRRSEAMALRTAVVRTATRMRWPELEVEGRGRLMEWAAALGDHRTAYAQADTLMRRNDSLVNSRFEDELAVADVRFETERRQRRISEQHQALQLAEAEDRRKRVQRDLFFAIAVALSVVAVLLWRGLRIRRRLAERERQVHRQQVDELMHQQEIKAINAMLEGQEKERDRVARDLHDRLGSMLSAIKMQLGSLEARVTAARQDQQEQYGKVTNLLDEAVGEVRRISHDLVATSLSRFGLQRALEDLCDSIRVSGRMDVELTTYGLEQRLERSVEIVVYRIVQELVSNVLKHARATEIGVSVTRQKGRLSVMVSDDGAGFDPVSAKAGMGLNNVRDRAASIGGTVRIDSTPGKGTTVSVECPVVE